MEGGGGVLEAGTCPTGALCIKEDLPSSRRGGQEGLDQAEGGWSPSVWLLIQEAGEHGEGSLGLVGGDHVTSALGAKLCEITFLCNPCPWVLPPSYWIPSASDIPLLPALSQALHSSHPRPKTCSSGARW